MAPNNRFGQLLSEGISSVANRQQKKKAAVEDEIAERLGYSNHTVQHWRRGNVPKEAAQVAQIVRYCVREGRVDRAWGQSILYQAQYPNPQVLLDEVFLDVSTRVRIFLCYARHVEPDEGVALQVAQALSRDYEVFFDQTQTIDVAWGGRIQTELENSDFVMIFLPTEANQSEVVVSEVEMAHELHGRQGSPRLLPIWLDKDRPLFEPLNGYVESLDWALWRGPEETPRLVAELKEAIAGATLPIDPQAREAILSQAETAPTTRQRVAPAEPLEMPEGTMDPRSSFYIEREGDSIGLEAIGRQGTTITIKGPRQVGKSSLLIQLKAAAEAMGKQVVFLDFQLLNLALSDADTFFRQFCSLLTYQLHLADQVEGYWSLPLPNPFRCTEYMGRYLLPSLNGPLVLAMDEVDRCFDTDFRTDFFGMLRSWHNNRAFEMIWKGLDLVLVTSTEPYYFIDQLNQSPFNVGTLVEVQPFSPEQIAELNQRHGSPLDEGQVARLAVLLNGHPYLVRRALYLVASKRVSVDGLFDHATDEQGPFGDHLRSLVVRLHSRPHLVQGLRQVLQEQVYPDETVFFRLRGAGLVRREGNRILPSSPLYAEYFNKVLQ